MSEDHGSKPSREAMVSRLSEVIMKEYPVSVTGLLNNYQLLFSQTIKPEEFDCSDMDSFVIKMSTEHNLWKVFYKGNNLWVKPSRVSSSSPDLNCSCSVVNIYHWPAGHRHDDDRNAEGGSGSP